jgi:tetratricopeptide (TPR) repeat protein
LTLGVDYLREALRRQPDYDLWRLDLWRLLDGLGQVQMERGEMDAAQEAFSAALSTIEVLTTRDSRNARWAAARATALSRLAALPLMLGRWSDARNMLERAQTAAEAVAAQRDQAGIETEGRDQLAMIREELSRAMAKIDRTDEALALAKQALADREAALKSEPTNPARESAVIRARVILAEALLLKEEVAAALEQAALAKDQARQLTGRIPDALAWRVLAAEAAVVAAECQAILGQRDSARQLATDALGYLIGDGEAGNNAQSGRLSTAGLIVLVRAMKAAGQTADAEPWIKVLRSRGVNEVWLATKAE